MKLAVLLCVLTATAWAAPSRKTPPDKFARAASEMFKAAIAAEDGGDLKKASALYEKSLELAMHPNTVFNLAAVYERSGRLREAILEYEAYLALAPTASDAAAVRAKITDYERRPSKVKFVPKDDFDPKGGYLLLDGKIIKRPGELAAGKPFEISVPPGSHTVEVYTVVGYWAERFHASYGQPTQVWFDAPMPNVGNVGVMVSDDEFVVGLTRASKARFALPAGKQNVAVHQGRIECPFITVDAPANDDLAHVFINVTESDPPGGRPYCRKYEVTQQRLKF